MCPLPLEHAPICPSGLDLDTPSSKKPSLMLPAWIAPLLAPHSTLWCLIRTLGLQTVRGQGMNLVDSAPDFPGFQRMVSG